MTAQAIETRDNRAERIARHEADRFTYDELRQPKGVSHYGAAFPYETALTEIRWALEGAVTTIEAIGSDLDAYVAAVEAVLTEEQREELTIDPPTVEIMPADLPLEYLGEIEDALRGRS